MKRKRGGGGRVAKAPAGEAPGETQERASRAAGRRSAGAGACVSRRAWTRGGCGAARPAARVFIAVGTAAARRCRSARGTPGGRGLPPRARRAGGPAGGGKLPRGAFGARETVEGEARRHGRASWISWPLTGVSRVQRGCASRVCSRRRRTRGPGGSNVRGFPARVYRVWARNRTLYFCRLRDGAGDIFKQ